MPCRRVTVVAALSLALTCAAPAPEARDDRCGSLRRPHLLVLLEQHQLLQCQNGKQEGPAFSVRIGASGYGKRKSGDRKTPVGEYSLGPIRRSKPYGWFIPIGYPTPMQRQLGYTGGAVGVHGPDRRVRWLGGAVNWFDTTDGCVGLAHDEDVQRIGAWAKASQAKVIRLEP
ncbi:MAG: L,D-transpeptidase family protein [Myxococcales bacterium]|nr:L,D-transpeptidase family protein [Myxococcales bacterium]